MPTLDGRSRAALAAGAILCFIGALVLTPVTARSAAVAGATPPARAFGARTVTALTAETPRRDPFAAGFADEARAVKPAPATVLPASAGALPAAVGPLPPNLPSAFLPALQPASNDATERTAHVAGVVTGARPSVLVVRDGKTTIEGVGALFNGAHIRAVNLEGITLDDGRVFHVEAAGP